MANSKTYSIIIPSPVFTAQSPTLQSIRRFAPVPEEYEILFAIGNNPSAQRNAALAQATGSIIIFLDSDTLINQHFFPKIKDWATNTDCGIMGGPVLLSEDAQIFEKFSQSVFACRWITGPNSARYSQRGVKRMSSEKELILCNLCAHRDVIHKIGVFNENLYPNEENEWLDRAQNAHIPIMYDPDFYIFRPQRHSLKELFSTFFKYGKGRGRQSILAKNIHWLRFAPAALLLLLLNLFFFIGIFAALIAIICFVIIHMALITFTEKETLSVRFGMGLIGPFLILTYGAGTITGVITGLLQPQRPKATSIEVKKII